MYSDPLTGETWRFDVSPLDGTITRGRKYRLPEDYSGDMWRNYWDGDQMVAVFDNGYVTGPTYNDDTTRTRNAMLMAARYDQDVDAMLARLAPRIALGWGHPTPWEASFIAVGIDRGVTLYALSWAGDLENTWRDEIEAVNCGDVWRIETEEWDGTAWMPGEEVCAEWYGEDSAQRGFEREFPMADAPESLHQTGEN
jgi:hypothetical protein